MAILTVQNIKYDYISKAGIVHALKHASADFDEGILYAIVGRSGSGKSTFMSLLAGLDIPKSGTIFYKGIDLTSMDRDRYRREHVGMIFQSYYLLPQLTALENVELSLELSGCKKDKKHRAQIMLSMMGLSVSQYKKRSTEFSGGEQQRIAIARAIAPNPEIVLADEPTGNLDNQTSEKIVKILSDMAHRYGKCVILITHATEVAAQADIILRMNDGYLESQQEMSNQKHEG